MKLKQTYLIIIFVSTFFTFSLAISGKERFVARCNTFDTIHSADEIMLKLKKRYDVSGFQANFYQTITLNHMGIRDIAYGKLSILKPNKIRWEYTEPYSQIIICNDNTVSIFNQEDKQIIIVNSNFLLEKGIDIPIILDIGSIRDNFNVYLERDLGELYCLKLLSKETLEGLSSEVYLFISKSNYDLLQVKIVNLYGDETIIKLDRIDLESVPNPNVFRLNTSKDIDILDLRLQ